MALRIVTFNIQHGRGPDGLVDRGRLANELALLDADLLALQEVDVGLRRSDRVDQARLAAAATGLSVVFGPARRVGWWGRYGNALLVRGQIHTSSRVRLPRSERGERRAALLAEVEVRGRRISVAATHLAVDRLDARRQLDAVLAALVRLPSPRLLLGDLNLGPDDVGSAVAAAGMVLADGPPTYPASGPVSRIDHVATSGLKLDSVVVPEAAISDHRPLVVLVR
jgi:endonuclease/exonuclease/phosphatase family metal-dependent hydrolase